MSLAFLPSEILQHVILLVGPETFEDLALTCQKVYSASRHYLKEHNERRKRFRHFQFSIRDDDSQQSASSEQESAEEENSNHVINSGKSQSQDNDQEDDSPQIYSVLELLQYIAQYPVVARYIITADLSDDSLGDSMYDVEDAEESLIKDDTRGILRLLQTSPYLKERGYEPTTWLEAMGQTLDGHADVFLLTLLPNLEELVVSNRMARASYDAEKEDPGKDETDISPALQCRTVLEDIVHRANQHPRSDAALSRLRIVEGDCEEGNEYEVKNNFSAVSSLLAIQSVCSFYGRSFVALEDNYTGIGFYPRYQRFSPNLQQIVLESSLLGAMSASKLFSRIENLRVFRITWSVKYHGCGWNWDTGAMLHVLEQAAGDTLEELSIHDNGNTNMTGTVPVTLTGFKRLRVFESDFEYLCGEPFDRARQPEELCDDAEPGNEYQEEGDRFNTKVAPFVDFLPKTIERIFFNFDSWYQIVQQDPSYMFERMQEERASKLPQLVDISFVIPTVKEHVNVAFPVTVEMLPSVEKETEARDKLVALITSCGGTIKTQDWWSAGATWRTAY